MSNGPRARRPLPVQPPLGATPGPALGPLGRRDERRRPAPWPPATSKVSPPGGLVSSPGVCSILARRKRRMEQRHGNGGACGGRRRRRSAGDRHRPARRLRGEPSRRRRDAGRGRRRQGRAPGRALANRRHLHAAGLCRDDGRLPPDHGGSAIDRGSARAAVAPERGRWGRDPHAERGDPRGPRRDRHPGGSRRPSPARSPVSATRPPTPSARARRQRTCRRPPSPASRTRT